MEIDLRLKVAAKNAISRLGLKTITYSHTCYEYETSQDRWYVHFNKSNAKPFPVIVIPDEVHARLGSTDIDALADEIAKKLQALELTA